MSSEIGENPSYWLEAALRDVPLPPDLVARLKQLGVDDDVGLGRVLRRVALPEGLLQRLKQIPDDVALDRRLRRVAVGQDMLCRLKDIPTADSSLETAASSGIELARGLAPRLERGVVSARGRRGQRVSSQGRFKAAAWMVAASVVALATLGVWSMMPNRRTPSPVDPYLSPPIVLDAPNRAEASSSVADSAIEFESHAVPPDVAATSPELLARQSRSPSDLIDKHLSVLNEADGMESKWWMDADLYVAEQLAMPERLRDRPALSFLGHDRAHGWDPPAASGFDWMALLRDGDLPFVSPADHPRLRTVHLPLVTDVSSYRNYRFLLDQNELIAPQDVRTEEFLAAVDYGFAPPRESALELYALGGPSPWDPAKRKLLLLGIQARKAPATSRAPVEMTLVVDASLTWPGADAFAACRDAVERIAGTLQGGDRLSILLAAQRPIPLAQGIGTHNIHELSSALDRIGPQQIVDVVPAIEAAIGQAGRDDGVGRKLVVCVTSDLEHVTRSQRQRLAGLVTGAAERGVRFDVVRLTPSDAPDAVSAELAAAGAGEVHVAAVGSDLWPILFRLFTSHSAVAAQKVALDMEFNPRVVESYRILGHEPHSIPAGEVGNRHAVELLLDQSCVAMLEVKLRESEGGAAGTARLTWHDPLSGKEGEATQQVSAAQFAATLAEAALPLQRATVAAMTAEILRDVRYVPRESTLEDVLATADTLDGRLWGEPWFIDMVESIEVARAIGRPSRGRGVILFNR